ncbi:TetR/AcrR family transcriptional regulator [Streptomyces fagopyri]|uniref:TetR/AcrR family transcriptional regulator n=1 Tax=Streptomyces fagopyri TaxID=2662397 RepID=UPI00380CFA59
MTGPRAGLNPTRRTAGWKWASGRGHVVRAGPVERLFFSPGFTAVTMDDLARELGMSKKTIHRHFPDGRDLLAAVPDRQFAAVENTPAAATEDTEGSPSTYRSSGS